MNNFNINPGDFTYDLSYPSPPPTTASPPSKKRKSRDSETSSQSSQAKKKRKAWGQPVPEIVTILPPRKRAKTAEEKEQRKNERILRNRRAADKSRQRQKAAVADLEVRTVRIEQENITLKAMIDQYRSHFGELDGFTLPELPSSIKMEMDPEQTVSTPASTRSDMSQDSLVTTPAMAPTSLVLLLDNDDLPPLTQNLFSANPKVHHLSLDEVTNNEFVPSAVSGLTQYPAVMLCDLQCQPQTSLVDRTLTQNFIHFLVQLNLHWTIFETFSTTTLMPLYQLFQILAGSSLDSTTIPTISQILDNHFTLIIGLIFPPSQPTMTSPSTKSVFRMKLLSRLLTCSPKMARLLLAATDREMQVIVEDDNFVDDAGLRGDWTKLITLKWMIIRLEVEHGRYRRLTDEERIQYSQLKGVDYRGVERSSVRWRTGSGLPEQPCAFAQAKPAEVKV